VDVSRPEREAVIRRHCALIEEHFPERPALVQLKKHLAWYSDGLPFAARARPAMFAAETAAELYELFWRLW
jgi:tRNA-dihydrouridine synthase